MSLSILIIYKFCRRCGFSLFYTTQSALCCICRASLHLATFIMLTVSCSTLTSRTAQSQRSSSTSSSSSAGGSSVIPNPIRGPLAEGARVPIALLEKRATIFQECTAQAIAAAREAAAGAAEINNAHAKIVA